MKTPVSVVIAAKNEAATLGDQLRALTAQAWPNGGEIIVADNGSTDDTVAIAQTFGPGEVPIRVIECGDIPGAGHARNRGVEVANHERIAFCDADDVVSSSWIRAVDHALEDHDAIGGPLDLTLLNSRTIVRSRGREITNALPTFHGHFPVLSSCNLAIRRSTFDDVGGFDVSFLRGQDTELSLRLHEHGIEASFVPEMVVHYRLRTSTRAIFNQARGWGQIEPRLADRLPGDSRATPLPQTMKSWAWLGSRLPLLTTASGRARWAYVAGKRIGSLEGARRSGATA